MNFNPEGIHPIYEEVIIDKDAHAEGERRGDADVWNVEGSGKKATALAKQIEAKNGGAPITRQNLLDSIMEMVASGYLVQQTLVTALDQAKRSSIASARPNDGANFRERHGVESHQSERLPDEVIEQFMRTSIPLPGGGSQTVLENAHMRLAESALLFSKIMQSAYSDAKKVNPSLDSELASPANRMVIDDNFAKDVIGNYPEWHPGGQGPGCGGALDHLASRSLDHPVSR